MSAMPTRMSVLFGMAMLTIVVALLREAIQKEFKDGEVFTKKPHLDRLRSQPSIQQLAVEPEATAKTERPGTD